MEETNKFENGQEVNVPTEEVVAEEVVAEEVVAVEEAPERAPELDTTKEAPAEEVDGTPAEAVDTDGEVAEAVAEETPIEAPVDEVGL